MLIFFLFSLVADKVIFNSEFNMNSFLNTIHSFMSIVPDYRPKQLSKKIAPKCSVLYFPVNLENSLICSSHVEGKGEWSLMEAGNKEVKKNCKEEKFLSDTFIATPPGKVLHILWPHRW